ncbi:hypothetical protein JCM3774_000498 [Rhodotorula dairenensis]
MSPRLRTPFRPWLVRLHSTARVPELPSPLQRELFRRVAQPVAVITAHIPDLATDGASPGKAGSDGGAGAAMQDNHGATLSSLTSISLSPPLVSFSLRLPSRLATFLSVREDQATSSEFRVHLLSTEQESVARAFARQAPLPAPAQPSPPGPPHPLSAASGTQSPPALAAFDSSVFADLESASLGSMRCRVVRQIPLANLDSTSVSTPTPDQPRSELFIAQVDDVQLGSGGSEAASLLYWDQRYAGVGALKSST